MSFTSYSITLTNDTLNFFDFLNNMFIGSLIFFSTTLIVVLFLLHVRTHIRQALPIFSVINLLEEELGAIEDYFILGLLFLSGLAFFLFAPLTLTLISPSTAPLASLFVIFTTGCLVPASVLSRFGIEVPQFIRGAGKTTNFFYEFILDFVSLLTIFVRFGVQNIRIVFLVFAYWELYVFVETAGIDFLNLNDLTTMGGLVALIGNIILYVYYVGHLIILYTVQITAYLGLSFWLFFFLYTNFSSSKNEVYFNVAPKTYTFNVSKCYEEKGGKKIL